MTSAKPPIVVIVGETGSGKSALALMLAMRFSGEIIAADSRTVYRGMDIGTAKPTKSEQQAVRHVGLDVVKPGETFNAFDFKRLAEQAIADMDRRDKLPIVVGGTGLYIDALLYDFSFRKPPDQTLRTSLENVDIPDLQRLVLAANLPLPENRRNPRHLRRILESGSASPNQHVLRPNTLVLGMRIPRDVLRQRISERIDAMVEAGLVEEARWLFDRYGDDIETFKTPGYAAIKDYLRGDTTLEAAKNRFMQGDLSLAKRQRTWFKRNQAIHWIDANNAQVEATELVASFLCEQ